MTDGPPIERGSEKDVDAILDLINHVQPHVPWDCDHLVWQFFAPPAGPARLYVIRDGAAIVSLYVAVPKRFRAGNEVTRAWMVQDVLTRPDFRGRGFLQRLGKACFDEIAAAGDSGYTFPNKLSEGSFRRAGWTDHGLVPRRSVGFETFRASAVARCVPTERLSASAVDAWVACGLSRGAERDDAFLAWRYARPRTRYERFLIEDVGYLVLKRYSEGAHTTVHVCDLVVRADARERVPAALGFVRAFAEQAGADKVTSWLPADHAYAGAFDAAGLGPEGHDRYMFVLGAGDAPGWHLTQGDSDVY